MAEAAAAAVVMADWFVKCAWQAKKVEEIKYLRQMGDRAVRRSVAKTARQQPRTTGGNVAGNRIDVWAEWGAAGTYVGKVYISAG